MCGPLISYLNLFGDITPDEALIAAVAEHRVYREGEVLLRENSIAREMFFICKGVLKITSANEKGNDVVYFMLKENQFCTILNSFTHQEAAKSSIVAACDAEVLAIGRTALYNLYEQRPYIKQLITSITQQRLIDKIEARNMYMGKDAATRYKQFMMQEADIALRVPLADIASYLGITPQSLSRIRKNIR